MAEVPALDAAELLAALSRHDVDCVLIGGMAIQAYGHVRTTVDLDVIAAWTPENMRRLAAALGELRARLRGVDADLLGIDLTDPEQLYSGGNFLMRTAHGDLDVFAVDQTAGAPRSYEQLRARAVAVEVLGARILIAHPEDLIRMKTAASRFRDRPEAKRRQDLDDIAVLERLRADRDAASAARALEPTRSDRSEPGQQIQKPGSGRTPRTPRKPPQDPRRRH
jgi:hypothetical protein